MPGYDFREHQQIVNLLQDIRDELRLIRKQGEGKTEPHKDWAKQALKEIKDRESL